MSEHDPKFVSDTRLDCGLLRAENFNERVGLCEPDMLVLHYTGMPDGKQAEKWLCIEESQVSCHYIIHEDGEIVQLVPEHLRAWHAGKSSWRGHDDINSRSIGIEIVNSGHDHGYPDFPKRQMEAVVALCQDILSRHEIVPRNVVAHSDIAPLRKQDPGEKFDWKLLFEAGIGLWTEPSPIEPGRVFKNEDKGEDIKRFQRNLHKFGYGVEVTGQFDALTEATIVAFQRHYRQERVDGVADPSTLKTLAQLLELIKP